MDKIGLEYYNAALKALQEVGLAEPEDLEDTAAKLEKYLAVQFRERSAFV